jgi:hypothetical protein
MRPEYIEAVEKRLAWRQQMARPGSQDFWREAFKGAPFGAYRAVLDMGETYVMVPKFCEMVEAARETMPDDLAFELPWVLSPMGWIWFAKPFTLPFLRSQTEAFRQLSTLDQLAALSMPLESELVNGRMALPITPELVEQWVPVLSLSPEQRVALTNLAIHYSHGVGADDITALAQAIGRLQGKPSLISRIRVRAVGWYRTDLAPEHANRVQSGSGETPDLAVFCFGDQGYRPFSPLAHFGLHGGAPVGPRIAAFEAWSRKGYLEHHGAVDAPYDDPPGLWRHEIRLVYTVFHLMAQKLALRMTTPTDRATRRRAERNKQTAPPTIEVVTLRRLEADRRRDPTGHEVDWQWSWTVGGHWRKQWYPSERLHKEIYIETYIKGPPDKPLKNTIKIFAARR